MTSQIQPYTPGDIAPNVQAFSDAITEYLNILGLPQNTVLVGIGERRQIINIMPSIVEPLTLEQRQSAMYISKFIAACASGLFDAALNYLWNETINNLRAKVARFDLTYFYDSVISDPNRRARFQSEEDLQKLDDWELITGCRETGIISPIGYKHLDYIRDMRNFASAAHPNQNELSGLQLAAWLQTCIREVLGKEPEGPVVEIRKLLHNLRHEILTANDIPPISAALSLIPEDLIRSLHRAIFGMYTDAQLSADTRNNIQLIASEVWQQSSDDTRFDIALKAATISANGQVSRFRLARDYLQIVDGLSYLPQDALAVEINTALEALYFAHNGWNNFYNEPSPAKALQVLIPSSGNVPDSIVKRYVKILTLCRIGNGSGICWTAQPIYDDLIGKWQNKHILLFIDSLAEPDMISRLQFPSCAQNYQSLATSLRARTTHPGLNNLLDLIISFVYSNLWNISQDTRLKSLRRSLRS